MIVQSLVIPFVLVVPAAASVGEGSAGRLAVQIAVSLTVAVTVASGIPYVMRGIAAFSFATDS
jgi:hypothetical protein